MLVKLVLRQRMTLNEWEEKQIDELDEESFWTLFKAWMQSIHRRIFKDKSMTRQIKMFI